MINFTFVTALYDISREKYDGRTYKEYQEWFKKTLCIPVNMVIYTEKCNENMVNEVRKNLPTKLIITDIDDVPFYYTRDTVEYIVTKSEFKKKVKHPNGLENRCFNYIPIVNSKFVWMSQAIQENYFQSEMFFWIDAGLSRFMRFNLSSNVFNEILINDLYINNKIYIQIGKEEELLKILNNNISLDESIGKNINYMMAGFWGGNSDLIKEICDIGAQMYIEEYINKERADNEQVLFGFILKNYLNNLYLIPNNYGIEYINYYMFCKKI